MEKDAAPRLLYIDVGVLTSVKDVAASGDVCGRHRQHFLEAMRWSRSFFVAVRVKVDLV